MRYFRLTEAVILVGIFGLFLISTYAFAATPKGYWSVVCQQPTIIHTKADGPVAMSLMGEGPATKAKDLVGQQLRIATAFAVDKGTSPRLGDALTILKVKELYPDSPYHAVQARFASEAQAMNSTAWLVCKVSPIEAKKAESLISTVQSNETN